MLNALSKCSGLDFSDTNGGGKSAMIEGAGQDHKALTGVALCSALSFCRKALDKIRKLRTALWLWRSHGPRADNLARILQ